MVTDSSHTRGGAHIGWGAVAVVIALLINLFGLVWGAATIKATVDNLKDEAVEFRSVVTEMQKTQSGIVMELNIVTERQRVMQIDVEDHNQRLDKMEGQ